MKSIRNYIIVGISCLIIGGAIAYLTMQTTIKIKDSEIKTLTTTNVELKASKETLIAQNTKLKQQINQQQNQHVDTITYPDGTVHTVINTSTNTQTVNELTTSIETKIKEEYDKKFTEWTNNWIKTHEQEITNPKYVSAMLFATIGPDVRGLNFLLQGDVFGRFGVVGGFGMNWNMPITNLSTTAWPRPNFVGHGGVSYKF